MCVVIDTNTFGSVFNRTSSEHEEFAPVLNWITNGKGKIVYGGTKYREELRNTVKYLKIFGQFAKKRKVVLIDDNAVDQYQTTLESIESHRDFDDPHLVAICYVSKCRIICTNDKRAIPFLTRKKFYPNNSPRPKLYTKKRNSNLLRDRYIADICNPCIKLNRQEAEKLENNTANIV